MRTAADALRRRQDGELLNADGETGEWPDDMLQAALSSGGIGLRGVADEAARGLMMLRQVR